MARTTGSESAIASLITSATVRVLLRRASGELVGAVSGRLEHLALEELPGEWHGPIMDLEP